MTEARWVDRDAAVVWHGFTQMATYPDASPVIVERAEGRELIDVEGRRYLDAISSLWVTTLGHRVPELDQAVRDQLDLVAHSTILGNGNRTTIEFAEALVARVPVDGGHVLFASDGAAAVEQAVKIAFQLFANRDPEGRSARTGYLALGGAYHGDTVGSLSIGAGGFGTDLFDPLRFDVHRCPGYDDPRWDDAALEVIAEHGSTLAALVIEPLVQGAAGMWVTTTDQVRRVVEAAQRAGVLVVADEVAVGFGRTGTLFASEQCGIRPDLLCVGKGITGGYLPLAATIASDAVYASFLGPDLSRFTLYHGHSYSGNALACAVAKRHLELLDERDVLASVRRRADELAVGLATRVDAHPAVAAVRQRGLMVGVELAPPGPDLRWGRRACAGAVARGVLLRPLGDVVVLMPPLTTTTDELDRILDALVGALDDLVALDGTSEASPR